MNKEYIYNTSDTVDTGQYGARKNTPPSEQERKRVFTNFRKRLQKADLSFLDKK